MTTPSLRHAVAALAVATAVLAPAAPAFAFHHTGVPASACGEGEWAGGNNPVAKQALIDAGFTLPIAPADTSSHAGAAAAWTTCH